MPEQDSTPGAEGLTGGQWTAMLITAGLLTGAVFAWKADHRWWTWALIAVATLMSLAIRSPKSGRTSP